jgi:methyltransferase-like protein/predicted O-methyltransferase YrrM
MPSCFYREIALNQRSKTTSYNDIPYESFPFQQTHPDRLATIAKLFGLQSPNVETCKVLEIGCASGNNLIPMAEYLPKANFLGIDLSANQIDEGNKLLKVLNLPNIELRCQDILDFNEETKFDFIIVHGIYSWVPAPVQEKILAISKKNLSPDGVAYISYNVLPGWHMRGMIRDMMLYHSGKFPDNESKIKQAKALLEFLSKSVQGDKNPYGMFLQSELEILKKQNDGYFFHEFLEENNFPVYFHEFSSASNRHGLKYIGDSDVRTMSTRDLTPEAQQLLTKTPSMIETEQYMDFLRNRMFRTSLIVHDNKNPIYNLNSAAIVNFNVISTLTPAEQNMDLHSANPAQFITHDGATIGTTEPLIKAALLCLFESSPNSMNTAEIIEGAFKRLGSKPPIDTEVIAKLTAQIGQTLITAYTSLPAGSLELTTRPINRSSLISSKPRAFKLAQIQAGTIGMVTNPRHQMIRLGDFEKVLLPMLDGKTTITEIINNFIDLVNKNKIVVKDNGIQAEATRAGEIVHQQVENALQTLAKNGMLVD